MKHALSSMTLWTQLGADIDGEAEGDFFGNSGVLEQRQGIMAIGANMNDDNGFRSGHVRVYENVNALWTQLGSDIDGEAPEDKSGYSVSLSSDGSIVAIGANMNDGNGTNSGHVRVYKYGNDTWTQLGDDIDGEAQDDRSGESVSLSDDGSIVAIGSINNDDNGNDSGHVRVYQYNGSSWTQLGPDIDGEAQGDYFGKSVSLSSDGSIVAIGAFFNDDNGTNSGHVRVYKYGNDTWTQLGDDIEEKHQPITLEFRCP